MRELAAPAPHVLMVADALCRFNPIHGRGMSVAKQARLLQDALGRAAAAKPDPIAAMRAGLMAEIVAVFEAAWENLHQRRSALSRDAR